MRVLTIINGYTGALCLKELIAQGHEVVGVVTAPGSSSQVSSEETVIGVATQHLLPIYMPLYEVVGKPAPQFLELVRCLKPDLLVSMHYPAIFKSSILEIPRLGCVNIHPSRVPEGRGMTPLWWYLYLGRKTAWTALHYLDAGVDSGDLISHGSTPIRKDDTGASVSRRISEISHALFREHLPGIANGTAPRQKQDLSQGSYLWSGKNWQEIRWTRGARGIRGQIRCFTGTTNNAYTHVAGRRLRINDAEIADPQIWGDREPEAQPGELIAITGEGLLVQTGKGKLLLTEYAFEETDAPGLDGLLAGSVPVVLG